MAALTADAIVDRIRSICVGAPFALVEAEAWDTFELQPDSNIDGVFRIPPPIGGPPRGGFDFVEEREDLLQIFVARKHNGDHASVRRTLVRDMHSLTAAISRDGLQVSGDYDVPDEGRAYAIEPEPEAAYVTLRLTLPIAYDAQL